MKRWIKWVGMAVATLAVIVAIAIVVGLQLGERKKQRVVDAKPAPVAYVNDAASLERGRYLFSTRGCVDCHGANGAGRDFVNEGSTRISGPNITPGGVVKAYKEVDWVRIIRHGVKPDGTPAQVMPSEDYNRLTDADLASLVAHVRSLAPAQGGAAIVQMPLPARVMYGLGAIPDAAMRIDHRLPPQAALPASDAVALGKYAANMCIGCHGEGLSGGKIVTGPPDWPAAANLTPGEGSVMPRYKDVGVFMAMMKNGKRPDGTAIAIMPFESLAKIDEAEMRALHAHLQTLAARPFGKY